MRNKAMVYALRIAATLALFFLVRQFVVGPFRCNREIALVHRRSERLASLSDFRAAEVARNNIERLRGLETYCRTEVNLYLLLAGNARELKDPTSEIEYLNHALAIDERPEIYFNRGMAYFDEGNLAAAVADFVIAARFNPSYLDQLSGELRLRVTTALKAAGSSQ